MSKGSKPRPYSVTQEQFSKNWDNIFKKEVSWDHYNDMPSPSAYDIPVLENEEMWSQRVIDEEKKKEK